MAFSKELFMVLNKKMTIAPIGLTKIQKTLLYFQ
jgi:hypothetical protein